MPKPETGVPHEMRRYEHRDGEHWDGIITWHANHLSNGLLEGINAMVQAAKARARGYRNKNKMITIVYLMGATGSS